MTQPYDGRACVHNDCAYAGYLQAELLITGGDRIYVYMVYFRHIRTEIDKFVCPNAKH